VLHKHTKQTYTKRPLPLILFLGTVIGCSNSMPVVVPIETPNPPTQTPVVVIEVQEVPVTQIVEVTRQVEVTRIVQRVITATPEPTQLPTVTPTPEPTRGPVAPAVKTLLLNSLTSLRREIEAMNFDELIVRCSRGYEDSLTDHYESIIVYPTYDVTNASPIVQTAYSDYRQAVATITSSNRDLYTFCLDWLAKGGPPEYISNLTASVARHGIDEALGGILRAIDLLESE